MNSDNITISSLESIGSNADLLDSNIDLLNPTNNRHIPVELRGVDEECSDNEDSEKVSITPSKDLRKLDSAKSARVPRGERRGLLANLVIVPEYQDARDYPKSIKYLIVFFIGLAAITGPMGTSILMPAIDDVCDDLSTTPTLVNVSIGIYILSLGIFPMWWSGLSETYGRRSVYLLSFSLFFAFSIGTAFSPNIIGLIILRIFQGGCSASVQAVGAGTISDLFIQQEMGRSMGLYYLGPLLGPFCAPIIGGVVGEVWGWRATQWVLVIFSGINLISIMFFLPETLRTRDNVTVLNNLLKGNAAEQESLKERGKDPEAMLQQEELERVASNLSRRLTRLEREEDIAVDSIAPNLTRLTTNRSFSQYSFHEEEEHQTKVESFKSTCHQLFIRPIYSVHLLRHPPVALVICYSAISFGVLYFVNMTVTAGYSNAPYNFKTIIVGLMYIPNSVTYIMASIIGGRWNDKLLTNYARKHNGQLVAESRISWNVVTAVVMYPIALLIFGWTIHYGIMWVVPLVGTAIFGFASMLIIGATSTCLVDTLPGRGATGIALNNLIRQTLAAIATFVVDPLLLAIGAGVLFSILSGIIVISSFSLYYLKKHAEYYREHSNLSELYAKL